MPEPMYFRSIPTEVEYEIRTDGPSPRFTGYAAVFNTDSEPMPFVETIQPGAFTRTLKSEAARQTFVMDHDDTKLLASRRAQTLTLTEDSRGVLAEAALPDTSYARDLIELHGQGEARSMSFTFRVPRGGDSWTPDQARRTLTEVKLGHVTVLTGLPPAYRQTNASIRSLAHVIGADADALAEAIEGLRDNRPLTEEAVALLQSVIGELREQPPETVAPIATVMTIPTSIARARLALAARAR